MPPLGEMANRSASFSLIMPPARVKGATSNSGARARIANFVMGRETLSRSRSSRHCWEKGPCTTRPG